MIILVLNCGSSSIKYQVIDMQGQTGTLLAKGLVELSLIHISEPTRP